MYNLLNYYDAYSFMYACKHGIFFKITEKSTTLFKCLIWYFTVHVYYNLFDTLILFRYL